MLPKGWKQVPLHTVAEVRTGLSKNARREGATLKRPYLRVANVQDGALDLSDVQEIDVPASQTSRYTLQAGDLLLIEGNGNPENLGRGCLWHGQIAEAVHQNHVFAVRTHKDEGLLPEFLALLVQCRYGRDYFLSCAKGSTGLASLNSTQLKGFPVILPPFEEQIRIARVIDTWGAAIVATERYLANSLRQRDALADWLLGGKQRLSGHATKRKSYRLGALFDERVEVNRPDLRLLSITREEGVIPRDDVGRKDTSNEDKSKYLRVCPGDIAYNTMRMWQGVSALSPHEGIVSPAYTVVRPKAQLIDAQFAAYLFKYRPVVFLFYRYSQGLVSDTWNLKFHHFSEIKVEIPELSEQIAIANVLKAADEEIAALEKHLDCLREEKRALMADLLTGKRRVRVSSSMAESEAA